MLIISYHFSLAPLVWLFLPFANRALDCVQLYVDLLDIGLHIYPI